MEQSQVDTNGNTSHAEESRSFLTAQALAVAMGGIAYAIASIEHGTASVHTIEVLKKKQRTIRDLLAQ